MGAGGSVRHLGGVVAPTEDEARASRRSAGVQEAPQPGQNEAWASVRAKRAQEDEVEQKHGGSKVAKELAGEAKKLAREESVVSDKPLVEPEPVRVWKAFCVHFSRLFSGFIDKVTLLHYEWVALDAKKNPRASQFLAWRCSMLWCGATFFAGIVAFDAYAIALSGDDLGKLSILKDKVNQRYIRFLDNLFLYNFLNSLGMLIGSCAAVVLAAFAALSWRNFTRSSPALLMSFACSYLPPFVLLLLIPFRSGVDFKGIQQQMCLDIVSGAEARGNMTVDSAGAWPDLGQGDLSKLLREIYGDGGARSRSFCFEDPTTWGATIARLIEDRGLLSDDNGTCSFAEQQVVTLALAAAPAMAPSAGCPPGCADCMGGCRPHLLRVTALSSAIAQGAKLPSPALEACAHCASQAVGYECMQLCPEVFEEVARQTLTGRLPEGAGLSCVRPSELRDFQILSKLGAQTAYWELFLGTVYAVLSVGQLMPLALSLVLGAHKGSGIAKSVIPQSRLPGVVSVSASLLAFPFVFQLVVVIQSSVGTLLTLIAVLFLLLAVAFFMKPLAYLKANSNKELGKGESLRGTLAKLCILISLGFFVASAASSDLAATVLTAACKQDMCFSRIDLQQARSFVFITGMRLLANFLGKSLVSTVFFADSVVSLMHFFHYSELRDSPKRQQDRSELVTEIHTMYIANADANKVAPASDGEAPAQLQVSEKDEGTTPYAVVPMEVLSRLKVLAATMQKEDGPSARTAAANLSAALHQSAEVSTALRGHRVAAFVATNQSANRGLRIADDAARRMRGFVSRAHGGEQQSTHVSP